MENETYSNKKNKIGRPFKGFVEIQEGLETNVKEKRSIFRKLNKVFGNN